MKANYGLRDSVITTLTETLSHILANTHVLYVKTLHCHWNIEDAAFFQYHELFEKQYKGLAESVDVIAERIRMMGRKAPGSLRRFLELATLSEIDTELSAKEMVRTLAEDHETCIQSLRDAVREAEENGDPGTADLYVDLVREHEKTAWFLRSHL